MKKALILAALTLLVASGIIFILRNKEEARGAKIYFFNDGRMSYVQVPYPHTVKKLQFAAEQLLKGPDKEQRSRGFFTQIPANTVLSRISKRGRVVIADFSQELEKYGGGTDKVQGMLAQIVYTLTEPDLGADKVQILVKGKKEIALGSEGYVIDKPLSRKEVTQ